MLQPMRRAGPSLGSFLFTCKARVVACLAALAVPVSCSVYTNDLVDGASAGFTQSGSGGASSGSAGKSNGVSGDSPSGGKPGAGTGGAPDDTEQGGSGGEDPVVTPGAGTGGMGPATGGAANTAGTGGTGTVGGSAGTAGTGGGTTGAAELLDGFEDNDITLEQLGGRSGVWYLFDDGTTGGKSGPSPFKPTALTGAPEGLGAYAMHITASGFTSYGSGLGVDFKAGKKLYDISKFQGIRFWARVATGKNTRHRVQIPELRTDKLGGKCDPNATVNGKKCDDHFGVNKTFTTTWTQYSILFADMMQAGFGYPGGDDAKLDTVNTYGLQITAKQDLDVDLWVDEFEFF